MDLAIIILAAGKGTRMNSKYQKILHGVGGKPMVQHVFDAAQMVASLKPVMVVGPNEMGVAALFGDGAAYVTQPEQLGTGNATLVTKDALAGKAKRVIVTYGDMPLIKPETLARLAQTQAGSNAAVVMTTVDVPDPASSFGRVVRNRAGNIVEICEMAEAKRRENAAELLAISEMNAGVYCFEADFLWENIDKLPVRQARNGSEYYLTDMVEIAVNQGLRVDAVALETDEALGAGTRSELMAVEKAFRQRAIQHHLANGVTIVDPASTYIDQDIEIGQDSIICPNTHIQGKTKIGQDCIIGPNATVRSAEIGNRCVIENSVVAQVVLEAGTILEPFSHAVPYRPEDRPEASPDPTEE